MSQVMAIFLDSYRELNARKLFWITLMISAAVIVAYGSIGFTDNGITILYGVFDVESEYINAKTPWARALYMGIFSDFIVALWLAWVATILALISTTTIFPDLIASGAIDLILSKPISRLKLFGLKYLASLMFVVLQVAVFCTGAFLCVGLRVGEWNPKIFAAVPLVTLLFSYLFSVSVLTAMVTRSALAALLLTLLFWFSLWGIQTAGGLLNNFRLISQIESERASKEIARLESVENPSARATEQLENARERQADAANIDRKLSYWHKPISAALLVVPKTQETVALLSRWLKDPNGFDITGMLSGDMTGERSGMRRDDARLEAGRRMKAEIESRSLWYVLGTSVAFEFVVIGLAAFLFARRDF